MLFTLHKNAYAQYAVLQSIIIALWKVSQNEQTKNKHTPQKGGGEGMHTVVRIVCCLCSNIVLFKKGKSKQQQQQQQQQNSNTGPALSAYQRPTNVQSHSVKHFTFAST